jgi:hypothetical protein
MRIDPRNSLFESVPGVPQEFEVRATKIYPSRYCHNHSNKGEIVSYVVDWHHFPGTPWHGAKSKFSVTSRLYIELSQAAACFCIDAEQRPPRAGCGSFQSRAPTRALSFFQKSFGPRNRVFVARHAESMFE